jgi:pantothenate kinase
VSFTSNVRNLAHIKHHLVSPIFCSDEFKREDVARAWLNYVALDIIQVSHTTCRLNDVKRLFFCGGFCNHPLVRHVITTEMVRRNLFWSLLSQVSTGKDMKQPLLTMVSDFNI